MATSIVRSTFNTVGGSQTNIYYNFDPGRCSIAGWLSKHNFPAMQGDFLDRSEKGTGNWLLESQTFQNWRDGVSQVLWCPGNPGAGKTILASIVINYLQTFFKDCKVGVTCIYCNYKEQTTQTATNLIASVLKQLVQDSPAISDHINALYQRHQKKNTFPTLDEVTTTLETEIKTYEKVFIVVDGLDECSESDGSRLKLLRALRSLTGPINIMVTSRDLSSIEEHFTKASRIYIRATDGDVSKFIQSQLLDYPYLIRQREIIRTKIVENVKGMFLLARLHINMLSQQKSVKGVMRALDNLPSDIHAIYDQAMERIERQSKDDRELGERVLSWITYACRPLTVEELQHALAVSPDMTELDPDDLIFDSKLTSVCAGLVVIDGQRTIRFAHYTTQQYFENQRESRFPNAEIDIAATCLRYLSLNVFACGYCETEKEFKSLLANNPFLDYAATNWGDHARRHQGSVKDLAMDFLRDDPKAACASQVMLISRRWYWYSSACPKNFSGLHVVAFFNLDQIARYQVENGANPNLMDSYSATPLHIAAIAGSQDAVVILVTHGDIDPNSEDSDGRTPLSYAAEEGLEGVVGLLVKRDDVDADSKDFYGRTPFSYAAQFGHENVVKLLVGRGDVEADSKDLDGRTPFSYAAQFGHENVVKLLVERDGVVADSKDFYGQTPLSYAAQRGHEGVMKLLVERDDIDTDSKDSYGRTPLSYAARSSHEAVVKVLVERGDVNADSKDSNGRTPLSYAAQLGHEDVVKLLVALDDVDADSRAENGQTPLSHAAERGREVVVKLLVARDDVYADSDDSNGRTPLSYAAQLGHEGVVKLLVARDDVYSDSDDRNGRTPLSYAAERGHEVVVKLLVERDDVYADSDDGHGRRPLSYAAQLGHEGVVKLLVARDDVHSDSDDRNGRTPLSYAAEQGHEVVVKLLVERDGVNADSNNSNGRTPLSYAAQRGHENVLKLLVARDDVDADSRAKDGRTPLSYAAEEGCKIIAKLLVERDDVDPGWKDSNGLAPLSYAIGCGDEDIMKLLGERMWTDVKTSIHGQTRFADK